MCYVYRVFRETCVGSGIRQYSQLVLKVSKSRPRSWKNLPKTNFGTGMLNVSFFGLVLVLKIFQENLVIFAEKSNDYYKKI